MDKQDILEGNKLIAEFMGYTYFPFDESKREWVGGKNDGIPLDQMNGWHKPTFGHYKIQGWYLCRTNNELRYHRDWSWLMPVVIKMISNHRTDFYIDKMSYDNFSVGLGTDGIYQQHERNDSAIDGVFKSIVGFIKWYNEQKLSAI